jgi:hypothetical protein
MHMHTRLRPVWVHCVRGHAEISRQRESTTCTDACIARCVHQVRVDALWAACHCSEGALRWSGLAGAPVEVGLFCECDCAVGTFMLLSGLPLISGARLL